MSGFSGFHSEGSDCIHCREGGSGVLYCEIYDGLNCDDCEDYTENNGLYTEDKC